MENASKALIIAGAILISIVIISLGVMIVSNVMDTIRGANVSEQEREAYNQIFVSYEGTRSGTQVRALCDKVLSHNQGYPDDFSRHIQLLEKDASSTTAAPTAAVTAKEISDIKAKIKAGSTYTVTIGYDQNSGYVVAVGIQAKTK